MANIRLLAPESGGYRFFFSAPATGSHRSAPHYARQIQHAYGRTLQADTGARAGARHPNRRRTALPRPVALGHRPFRRATHLAAKSLQAPPDLDRGERGRIWRPWPVVELARSRHASRRRRSSRTRGREGGGFWRRLRARGGGPRGGARGRRTPGGGACAREEMAWRCERGRRTSGGGARREVVRDGESWGPRG